MKSSQLYILNLIFILLPPSRFYGIKRQFLRWCAARVGENARVVSTACIHMTGPLILDNHCYIGDYVLIAGGDASVHIGRNVDMAPRCTLVTGSHEPYTDPNIAAGTGYSAPITIGDGAWIGACVTVIGGVTIGKAALVAAGSLVNKDIAEHTQVGGVPARILNAKK